MAITVLDVPSSDFERRLSAVTPRDRKVLIIPMDHGLTMGNIPGLQRPAELLGRLIDAQVDGTLMSAGMAKLLGTTAREAGMSVTLTMDFQVWGEAPGTVSTLSSVSPIVPVEWAAELGADAVKALLVWGLGDEITRANVALAAVLAREAHAAGVPLMLEPLWFGAPGSPGDVDQIIVHGARIALELGADILKIPAVGPEALEQILAWGLPTLFLGGVKQDDPSALFDAVGAGLAAGADGVVIGRNVWQRPNMGEVIEQLRRLVARP